MVSAEHHVREKLHIVGAGPAGLASAIVAAKAGLPVTVHERRDEVGGRFHGDFQGLENCSTNGDVLEELATLGIQPTFDHAAISEQVCFDPDGREYVFRTPEPFYYLIRRGPGAGTLDQSLKEQAVSAGATVRFQDPIEHLPEGGIVSQGPRGADAIAVGYVFSTNAADGSYAVVDNRLAPNGYSYLLIHGGRGTIASCMFHDFHNEKEYLDRTVHFFHARVGFIMTDARRFGGFGNFLLPQAARRGRILFTGEAAGFQDALWGFGIRYAMLSGCLAAQAILNGVPGSYERLWRKRLGGYLRTGIVNRYLYEKLGHRGYRWLLGWLDRTTAPRATVGKALAPSRWKAALYPLARRSVRSIRKDAECAQEGCDCTWCRCVGDHVASGVVAG